MSSARPYGKTVIAHADDIGCACSDIILVKASLLKDLKPFPHLQVDIKLMVRTDEEAQVDWAVILDDRVLVSASDYYIDPVTGQRQYDRTWYDQLIDLDGAGSVSTIFNASERASRCYEAEPPSPEVRASSAEWQACHAIAPQCK